MSKVEEISKILLKVRKRHPLTIELSQPLRDFQLNHFIFMTRIY